RCSLIRSQRTSSTFCRTNLRRNRTLSRPQPLRRYGVGYPVCAHSEQDRAVRRVCLSSCDQSVSRGSQPALARSPPPHVAGTCASGSLGKDLKHAPLTNSEFRLHASSTRIMGVEPPG